MNSMNFRLSLLPWLALLFATTLCRAEKMIQPLEDQRPLKLPMRVVNFEDGHIQAALPEKGTSLKATIRPEGKTWNCSEKLWLLLDVENRGDEPVLVRAEVSSEKNKGWGTNKGAVVIPAGVTGTLPVLIIRGEVGERTEELKKLFDRMRGYPAGISRRAGG